MSGLVLEVVSEITGFPVEMLSEDLDLELESELGVDSIKRAEIFSKLQETVPEIAKQDLTTVMLEIKTMRHLNDLVESLTPVPVPA